MAHADDIGKYEGPPCDVCRVSQFVGTCTHRPRKYPEYKFPDFTTAEFKQMKAQKESIIAKEQDRVATAWMEQIADLQASLKTVCAERDAALLQIDALSERNRVLDGAVKAEMEASAARFTMTENLQGKLDAANRLYSEVRELLQAGMVWIGVDPNAEEARQMAALEQRILDFLGKSLKRNCAGCGHPDSECLTKGLCGR